MESIEWEPPKKRTKREFSLSSPLYQESSTPLMHTKPSKPNQKPKSDLDILCEMADVLYSLEVKPFLERQSSEIGDILNTSTKEIPDGSYYSHPSESLNFLPSPLPRTTSRTKENPHRQEQKRTLQAQQSQFRIKRFLSPKPHAKPSNMRHTRKPFVPIVQKFDCPYQEHDSSSQPQFTTDSHPSEQKPQPKTQLFTQRFQFHSYHFNELDDFGR